MLPKIIAAKIIALNTLHAVLQHKNKLYRELDQISDTSPEVVDERTIIERANRVADALREVPDQTGQRTTIDDLIELGEITGDVAISSETNKIANLIRIRQTRTSIVEMLTVLLRIDVGVEDPDCVALVERITEHIDMLVSREDPDDLLDVMFWKLMRTALQ